MKPRLPLLLLTLLLLASGASAAQPDHLLARAWPVNPYQRLGEIGRGVAVIFSPDLSVPGNCNFYRALGFECFDDADWTRVLDNIRMHNLQNPERRVRTLFLETHGTNGHGLKLQRSGQPKAERSYISVGAIQERAESHGVGYLVIGACNSGRLLRPMIYRTLDPNPGDKLFLPATCGIVNASASWNPRRSQVTVLTPATSQIESTLVAAVRELAPVTRRLLTDAAKQRGIQLPKQFAISDMMMQMMLRDSRLLLQRGSHVEELSGDVMPAVASERLFTTFVAHLAARAAIELPSLATSTPGGARIR